MLNIRFCGAAGMVTGSSYFLYDTDTKKGILIDLGMFQGAEWISDHNWDDLKVDPRDILGVLLTHAHLDHCGRLPLLSKAGYKQKIYMTEPTKDLIQIVLMDTVKIAEHDRGHREHPAMYGEADVYNTLALETIVEYDETFEIGPFKIVYRDAGHIMGSASIEVSTHGHSGQPLKIAFSGDLGNSPQDLMRPTEQISTADVVLMESTYGGRSHDDEEPTVIFAREIQEVEKTGGALLIPSFSLERTQEILHIIDHLKRDGKVAPQTAVYLDSPMAIAATNVYKKYAHYFNKEIQEHMKTDDPFGFEGLRLVEKHADSIKIARHDGPKVIIAGSGMMNGGRILQHATHFLPLPTTRLLFVGYQGEETIGRYISEGATEVTLQGIRVPIRASTTQMHSMSAHADHKGLMKWIQNIHGAKKIFLTHGDEQPRRDLQIALKEGYPGASVHIPNLYEDIAL